MKRSFPNTLSIHHQGEKKKPLGGFSAIQVRTIALEAYLLSTHRESCILATGDHPAWRCGHCGDFVKAPLNRSKRGGGEARGCVCLRHRRFNLVETPEPHLPHAATTGD